MVTVSQIVYPNLNIMYQDPNDIDKAINDNVAIKKSVDGNTNTYQSINIADAMSKLTQVGQLIQLAYTSSKGFNCSTTVIKLFADYQSLIKESLSTTGTFVQTCLWSLGKYRMALVLANKLSSVDGNDSVQKVNKIFSIIQQTADLAKSMAEESAKLVEKSDKLITISKEALVAANSDEVKTTEEKKKAEEEAKALSARQEKLTSMQTSLTQDIIDQKEKETKLESEVKDLRDKAFITGIVSAVASAVGSVASALVASKTGSSKLGMIKESLDSSKDKVNENIEAAKQQASEISTQITEKTKTVEEALKKLATLTTDADKVSQNKIIADLKSGIDTLNTQLSEKSKMLEEFQKTATQITNVMDNQVKECQNSLDQVYAQTNALKKELRDNNAELAGVIKSLDNTEVRENNLKSSISSLRITIASLGKIKTVFENVRLFWLGVEKQCNALNNVQSIKDAADIDKDEFTNQIKLAGLSWLSLAKINLVANDSMKISNSSVDNIMSDLPKDDAQIKKLVDTLKVKLLSQIEIEDQQTG